MRRFGIRIASHSQRWAERARNVAIERVALERKCVKLHYVERAEGLRERVACEFFVVRYVPDVVKGEFVNIGVVLREASRADEAVVRFTRDWSRVRCVDANVDVEMLEALELELGARLRGQDPKAMMGILVDSFSNSVQLAPARACLAESVPAEMEQLMRMYVEPIAVKRERRVGGRAAITGSMRREFERARVWDLMRKRIAVAQYTRAGDPMRIDCGYRPNGLIRMFQAVSLEKDAEAAKVLAYSAPEIAAGVVRVEAAKLELTAIVEPLRKLGDVEEAVERYRFGVEAMERAEIRVMTVSDLPRMAETARAELEV